MHIILHPTEGVTIDEKEIRLGMTRAEVTALMGEPETDDSDELFFRIYYYANALLFEFDTRTDSLAYIELQAGNTDILPELFGKPVFSAYAEELYMLLSEKNNGEIIDTEKECRSLFTNLGVQLRRRSSPELFAELAQDIKENGKPKNTKIIDETWDNAQHWQTVGIGTEQYVSDMKAKYAKKIPKIILHPTEGVTIDEKEIRLGMTRAEVTALMGEPETVHNESPVQLYYSGSELRFDFDADTGLLEFIEFLGGHDGALQPELYGVSVFAVQADELVTLLTEKNGGTLIDDENGYSYAFAEIGVGIWRERIPEDVEEMIAEAEEDGNPMDEESIAEEWKLANYWATVGIGGMEYYTA